jgi:hypothetical protein
MAAKPSVYPMCDTNYWGDISVARFDHVELAGESVSAGIRDDRTA